MGQENLRIVSLVEFEIPGQENPRAIVLLSDVLGQENLRFMPNYNEWLIGAGKLEDHGHVFLFLLND